MLASEVLSYVGAAMDTLASARRVVAIVGPVIPVADLSGALLAMGAALGLALLTGLAVGSLATLIIAVVTHYTILISVFGVSVDLAVA